MLVQRIIFLFRHLVSKVAHVRFIIRAVVIVLVGSIEKFGDIYKKGSGIPLLQKSKCHFPVELLNIKGIRKLFFDVFEAAHVNRSVRTFQGIEILRNEIEGFLGIGNSDC